MLKEGRDRRDASIKRIVSAQRPVSGLPGRECAPLDLPFLFLRNCKQPSYYTKFPASLQGAPSGPFAGTQAPATCDVRGAAPPREQVVRLGSCSPPMGAPPHAPGDFPVAGKVTKGAPRAAPFGIPPSAESPPLLRSLTHRAGLPSATKIDRFATLGLWANRSCFSPQALPEVTPSIFNPWLGRWGAPEDA